MILQKTIIEKRSVIDRYPEIKLWIEKIKTKMDEGVLLYKNTTISNTRENNIIYEFNFYENIHVSITDHKTAMNLAHKNWKESTAKTKILSYFEIYVDNWDTIRFHFMSRYTI